MREVRITDFHTIAVERTVFGPQADAVLRREACSRTIALAATH